MTVAMELNLVPLDIGIGCFNRKPYPTKPTVETFVVTQPNADLLLLHFDLLALSSQDYLAVRAVVNNTVGPIVETILGGKRLNNFFSLPVYTPQVVVELHVLGEAKEVGECYGFHIDGIRTSALDGSKYITRAESICGVDDSKNVECFVSTPMYTASKSVVRMLTHRPGGSAFCTGWLLGCEGHLITNQHCIQNPTDAQNTIFEFMAEGLSCTSSCESQGACSQQPYSRGAQIVASSVVLDYTLVKLDNIPAGLGYLQLRASGPVLQETVYIPQHPLGWGKRLAVMDGNKLGSITTLTLSGCATNQAGYMLDTQPGSSGSPVISTRDNKVVALHHCGGCPNAGIQAQRLVQDLTTRSALPRCSVA